MLSTTLLIIAGVAPILHLPTASWQPSRPSRGESFLAEPVIEKKRAVLLVPGLKLHPLNTMLSTEPEVHDWQRASSLLVKELATDFDVHAFGYAQTLPLDAVTISNGMRSKIAFLRESGYREIVLIGHSAGGVISKQFVETFPQAGVTKVIQVASPNAGSTLANIGFGLPKPQIPFIKSMTPEQRTRILARSKTLPEKLEFAAVVCKAGRLSGDTVVSLESQWPIELQQQGVPAALVLSNHYSVMKDPESVRTIVDLAKNKLVRWDEPDVQKTRKLLFETTFGKGLGIIKK